MKLMLKFLHLLGVIGFMGSAVCAVLLAALATASAPPQAAMLRQVLVPLLGWVLMPALLLAVLSGALAMMVHAPFLSARWVWVKAGAGMLIGGAAMFSWQPAVELVASLTSSLAASGTASGAIDRAALTQALHTEAVDAWGCLVLSLFAVALGVWRPQLGGGSS